jgi:hypothetical protein
MSMRSNCAESKIRPVWLGDPAGVWNDASVVKVNRNGQVLAYAFNCLDSDRDESATKDPDCDISQLVGNSFDVGYPLETAHYFPETGYTVANGFLPYWDQNGSFAVFSYPLTNDLQQDGTTMQSFERACFGWHPGTGSDRHDILLGHPGTDELATTSH